MDIPAFIAIPIRIVFFTVAVLLIALCAVPAALLWAWEIITNG